MAGPEIICERRGAAGLVTLNRPDALNAITAGMVDGLAQALDAWEADPGVTRVVVKGAGGKAFSAGGDIRALYLAGREGRPHEALAFWRREYLLNIRIKRYPKPYIALVDGIVMGGGVGLSLHGSHRVAGERYRFAMPEVGIGFFPDVGATWALPRLPGRTGMYLALTGERVGPGDAGALGLATHTVPSAALAEAEERLIAGEAVDELLSGLSTPVPGGPVAAERSAIDRCFGGDTVDDVLGRLDRDGSLFSTATAATIRGKAPSSVRIAFEQVRRGRDLTFEEAMRTEFRIVSRIVSGPDFYEGVRAAIIDKDGRPRWRDASLADVDEAWVQSHFAGLGPDELPVAA